jgi:hypothetical protein
MKNTTFESLYLRNGYAYEKNVRIFFIENCMVYNFCLIYFYDETYRLAEKCEKPIFATFDLE